MATSAENNIEQRLEQSRPSGWVPAQAGDKIIGIVRALGTCTSDFSDKPIPTLDIETADGVRQVRAYHSVLRRELAEKNPQVGGSVGISYQGKQAKKDGSGSYHAYRVEADRAGTFTSEKEDGPPF